MAKTTTEKEGIKKAPAKKNKKTEAALTPLTPEMLDQQIRVAAYYRWEANGKNEGTDIDDWYEAEKGLTN